MSISAPSEGKKEGGRLVLVLGGARSGKSGFALKRSEAASGQRVYIATAEALDPEMASRIRLHREQRAPGWRTIEEPRAVSGRLTALGRGFSGVVLIDCLTLWVTNLMMAGLEDAGILSEAGAVIEACRGSAATIVAVSNEVGLSIVPEAPLARRFRDVAGIVNQMFAGAADEVFFVAAGIPLRLK